MAIFSRRRPKSDLHIADPRFDEWEVVADFEDVQTARAFAGRLTELDIENVLTADWPLDRHGHGEVSLRVPGDRYGDATVALEGLDD